MTKVTSKILFAVMIFSVSAPLLHADFSSQSLQKINVRQKLGNQIPLELPFYNEEGREIQLQKLMNGKPSFLIPVYYECPMLCSLILNGFIKAIKIIPFILGKDFNVITFSFDPEETFDLANAKKANYVKKYGQPSAAGSWHFLTGTEKSIKTLTESIGYEYQYIEKTDEFAHASAIILLTPDGKINRYFSGVEFSARDFRLGLVEASQGKIGSLTDFLLLLCFHYDATLGKYSFFILNLLRVAGIATVLIVGFFIFRNLKPTATAQQK